MRKFATPLVNLVEKAELDLQFTNSMEFNYIRILEKGPVSAGVFMRNIQQEISQLIFRDPENREFGPILTFENYKDNTT